MQTADDRCSPSGAGYGYVNGMGQFPFIRINGGEQGQGLFRVEGPSDLTLKQPAVVFCGAPYIPVLPFLCPSARETASSHGAAWISTAGKPAAQEEPE